MSTHGSIFSCENSYLMVQIFSAKILVSFICYVAPTDCFFYISVQISTFFSFIFLLSQLTQLYILFLCIKSNKHLHFLVSVFRQGFKWKKKFEWNWNLLSYIFLYCWVSIIVGWWQKENQQKFDCFNSVNLSNEFLLLFVYLFDSKIYSEVIAKMSVNTLSLSV